MLKGKQRKEKPYQKALDDFAEYFGQKKWRDCRHFLKKGFYQAVEKAMQESFLQGTKW